MPLPLDSAQTILDCLRHYAKFRPDARAYTFVSDGERDERPLTYLELDERSTAFAKWLHRSAHGGQAAVLLFPSGLEFVVGFFACLKARVVAVPGNLARNAQHFARLQLIIQDSGARLILTTPGLKETIRTGLQLAGVQEGQVLVCDESQAFDGSALGGRLPQATEQDLAFLQYTSGSTGSPKGVMVTHGQLIANERAIQRSAGLPEHIEGAGWLPQFHDMGLIGATLQPVALGGHYAFMTPLHFVQRPLRWLELMSRQGSIASAAPNFALDLCVKALQNLRSAGAEPALDLRKVRTIFCGAEPVSAMTLKRFAEGFGPFGLEADAVRPCYGLAEGTLLVSGGRTRSAPEVVSIDRSALARGEIVFGADAGSADVVCCGAVAEDHEVRIVDPASGSPAQADRVGEVWVRGPSVTSGYWGQGKATRETFDARLDDGSGPFMRTGDLGFVLGDGLYVTGRIKELMIVRGRNYYPHDIEATILSALGADWKGSCTVFSLQADGSERVVAMLELARKQQPEPESLVSLVAAVREATSRVHELQLADVLVVEHGATPRTSSGKTQRLRCAELYAGEGLSCLLKRASSRAANTTSQSAAHAGSA